jgi:hypothetical protein
MNPDEYAVQQAAISAAIARYTLTFGQLFARPTLSVAEWLSLLSILYPQVEAQRGNSARLAREFYDSQRTQHHPELPRNDRILEGYSMDSFIRDMEPARKRMSQTESPQDAVGQLAAQAVRAVENAGRQQIIHAVEDDTDLAELQEQAVAKREEQGKKPEDTPPEERVIRGWARVATGRETCAWCLMLISRGPVYLGADSAGLDLADREVTDLWDQSGGDLESFFSSLDDHMERWHPNCDCKVVPVFKTESWPGKDEADRALKLWNEATKQAIEEEEDEPDRTHTAGKKQGKKFTRNERALNALRRALYDGQINPADYAAAAPTAEAA